MLSRLKSLVILPAIWLLPFAALAQKLNPPNADPFTNETTYSTTMVPVSPGPGVYLNIYFSKINGDYYINLQVELSTSSYNPYVVSKGSELLFKFDNNNIMRLFNANDAESKSYIFVEDYTHQELWVSTLTALLSEQDLNTMSLLRMAVIRVAINNENFDFYLRSKDAQKIFKQLALIKAAN